MPNNLYKALGGDNQLPPQIRNFNQMVREFQKFKANFQGDPKKEVERLLQSGRMSQQQLNQLQEMAKEFQNLMNQ